MCPNNKEIVFDSPILCLLGTVLVLSCYLLMSCLYVGAGLLAFIYMLVISTYCSEACIGRLVCAWLIVATCFILVVLFLSISHYNMQFWTKTLVHHCVCFSRFHEWNYLINVKTMYMQLIFCCWWNTKICCLALLVS